MSDLSALRERLDAFVEARDWRQFHTPRNLAACLSVEAGELLELFTWTREGPGPHPPGAGPPPRHRIQDELADVMLCILNFAQVTGIDPIKAAEEKLALLEHRYPAHAVRGSAEKRPGSVEPPAEATDTAETAHKPG